MSQADSEDMLDSLKKLKERAQKAREDNYKAAKQEANYLAAKKAVKGKRRKEVENELARLEAEDRGIDLATHESYYRTMKDEVSLEAGFRAPQRRNEEPAKRPLGVDRLVAELNSKEQRMRRRGLKKQKLDEYAGIKDLRFNMKLNRKI